MTHTIKSAGPLMAGLLLSIHVGAACATSPVQLDTLTISAERETADGPVDGYRAARSASATRNDTPLAEVPQAVSVVPVQVLDDLDSSNVERALDFAGGVARQNDFGGLTLYEYSVRGLTTAAFYRDGFAASRGYMNSPDPANLERIEVLKGPSSSLYGQGDPGGTVSLVSKQPQASPFTRLELGAGSWDRYRGTLDTNGALTDDASLLGRLNLAVEDAGHLRDHLGSERQLVAPSLAWEASPQTRVLLQAEVLRSRQVFDRGIVAPGGDLGAVSRRSFFGEPRDGHVANNNETIQAALEHDLNPDWTLRLASHYKQGRLQGHATEPSSLQPDQRTLNRNLRYRDYDWQDAIGQLELHGQVQTGGIEHRLLIAAEYERYALEERMLRSVNGMPIDLYQPNYGQPRLPFAASRSGHTNELVHGRALNVQDQLRLSERLFALVGARYDHYQQRLDNEITGGRSRQTQEQLTPRAGVLYQLTPDVGVFANASRSFKPNRGADATGRAFDPEQGSGYEVGTKIDLFDGELGLTVAAFQLNKENVLTSDPANGDFNIAAGEVRSRGLDLQLSGQLGAVRLIGGYAFVDAHVSRDTRLASGTRLANVPRHSGSLLAVYEFKDGQWRGLELGGALHHVGKRAGDSTGTGFELPGYSTVDALARYRLNDQLTLGVNANNLFDKRYYEHAYNNLWVMPGEPRNLSMNLSWQL